MTRQNKESIIKDKKKEHPSESESLNRKNPKLEKNKTIDILNNIKSFSSLKKFTICSIFLSIILLLLPWAAEVSPINIVEMKNKLLDIIKFDNIPFKLNLLFNLGVITALFLVLTIFAIYKNYYKLAGALQFLNMMIVIFVVSSNYSDYQKGKIESLIEKKLDNIEERKSYKKKIKIADEIDEVFYDYGFTEKEQWNWMFKIMFSPEVQEELLDELEDHEHLSRKDKRKIKKKFFDWDLSIIHLTPIFFMILFFTDCILIVILSISKRGEISR